MLTLQRLSVQTDKGGFYVMKNNYTAPKAEVVTFAKEDVITSSGTIFDWNLPSVDLGDKDYTWGTENSTWQ